MKRLHFAGFFATLLFACSAPAPVTPVEEETFEPPAPECVPGCALNVKDQCMASARVVDGARTSTIEIECDARCCDPAFQSASPRDADGDGIPDDRDQCPEQPEDFDGFQDEDGCPDPDNDGDGILDVQDICPLDAEDFDGFQDDDGCPD